MGRLLGVSGRVCWGSIGESSFSSRTLKKYYGRYARGLREGVPGVYREIIIFL
jgi:hypothetical protein